LKIIETGGKTRNSRTQRTRKTLFMNRAGASGRVVKLKLQSGVQEFVIAATLRIRKAAANIGARVAGIL